MRPVVQDLFTPKSGPKKVHFLFKKCQKSTPHFAISPDPSGPSIRSISKVTIF